jgi:hypothetical protein
MARQIVWQFDVTVPIYDCNSQKSDIRAPGDIVRGQGEDAHVHSRPLSDESGGKS